MEPESQSQSKKFQRGKEARTNPGVWMRAAASVNSFFSYVYRRRNRHKGAGMCVRVHVPSSSSAHQEAPEARTP